MQRLVILAIIANVNTAVQVTDTRNENRAPLSGCWRKLLENREQALFIIQT